MPFPSDSPTRAPSTGLLPRAQAGDGAAFAALIRPLEVRLLAWITRNGKGALGPDFGPEDALQVTLQRAWGLLQGFEDRSPGAFYRWLVSLAQHALRDRSRYVHAQKRGPALSLDSSQVGDPLANLTSVDRAAARQEEAQRLDGALARMGNEQRDVIERHLLAGESLATIAGAYGVTKNAAWERLRRALAVLRGSLGVEA